MYTLFYDLSSGGYQKEGFQKLAVNLSMDKAEKWFEETYGHDPYRMTCDCCGPDYSVYEFDSLEELRNHYNNVILAEIACAD